MAGVFALSITPYAQKRRYPDGYRRLFFYWISCCVSVYFRITICRVAASQFTSAPSASATKRSGR